MGNTLGGSDGSGSSCVRTNLTVRFLLPPSPTFMGSRGRRTIPRELLKFPFEEGVLLLQGKDL